MLVYGSAMAILRSRQRLLMMNITVDIACQECGKFFSDESGFKRHFRDKIELFRNTWLTLMQDHEQTMPLKVHIIVDHLSYYFELESKTLRNTNDQIIEACHSKVRKFFDNHPNFNHKDKSTDMYGDAILTAITHFNSYNLGSVQKNLVKNVPSNCF